MCGRKKIVRMPKRIVMAPSMKKMNVLGSQASCEWFGAEIPLTSLGN